MTDTIRWCFTCKSQPHLSDSGQEWWTPGCEAIDTCDVADALVIRADQDVYLIDWVEFEQKHPRAFSFAAQCGDVIVRIGKDA